MFDIFKIFKKNPVEEEKASGSVVIPIFKDSAGINEKDLSEALEALSGLNKSSMKKNRIYDLGTPWTHDKKRSEIYGDNKMKKPIFKKGDWLALKFLNPINQKNGELKHKRFKCLSVLRDGQHIIYSIKTSAGPMRVCEDQIRVLTPVVRLSPSPMSWSDMQDNMKHDPERFMLEKN